MRTRDAPVRSESLKVKLIMRFGALHMTDMAMERAAAAISQRSTKA